MITIKILISQDLINDACALLYKVYVEKMQWNFSSNTPSQIRVEIVDGRKLLVDRFVKTAIWFGAFEDDKLVGCGRLCGVDENNMLEIESYLTTQPIRDYLPPPHEKHLYFEITKIVVDPAYAGRGITKRLFLAFFKHCEKNGYSVSASTHNGYLKSLFNKIGLPLKMEHAFKYEELDPMPVNFYFAKHGSSVLKQIIKELEYLEDDVSLNSSKIFKALEFIAPFLPTPVYWHDTEGVVLGINEHCLKAIGTSREIIGKKPYDFYPKEIAEHILKHNEQIMRTGEISSQEESIRDITTGAVKHFSSIKAPLYDDEGTIIGIIGSSVEITAEKEAERLKRENEAQQIVATEQEKFRTLVKQMIHDLTSPITSIDTITQKLGSNVPEQERVTLRNAAGRIVGISQKFLSAYENKDIGNEPEDLLVSLALVQIMNEKKEIYIDSGITITTDIIPADSFLFISLNSGMFKRMISNLINNAVDAVKARVDGRIKVLFGRVVGTDKIIIVIEDNGYGMPQHVQDKFKEGVAITEGKDNGHGIGLTQVRDTVISGGGEIDIYVGKINGGTKISLTFPIIETPSWIATEIKLTKDDTVIVLDDDNSIHGAWKSNFKEIREKVPTIKLKHYTHGAKAIKYINHLTKNKKQDVFLLADYELLNQKDTDGSPLNGLKVVAQTGMRRAILVTSYSLKPDVQAKVARLGIKLLPKELASAAKILVDRKIEKWSKKVDMVWVEDQKWFVDDLVKRYYSHLTIDTYYDPIIFMEYVHQYPLDTKIILDTYYDVQSKSITQYDTRLYLTGFQLAAELHEMGYTKLILLSGEKQDERQVTGDYLTVLYKDNEEHKQSLDQH